MADKRRSDFYVVFYYESLRTWIKTTVNKFAISNHTILISGLHVFRSCLKLICEYELDSLPNKKVSVMVKTTSRSDRPWSAVFCVNWFQNLSLDVFLSK